MAQQDSPDADAIENELEQIQDKLRQLSRDLTARKAVHVHGAEVEDDAQPSARDD